MTPFLAAITPEQVGAYATALLFACMAAYERFVNRKRAIKTEADQETLSEARAFKERGDLMLKQADEYRMLLEKEYSAHQKTREFHHDQATLVQEKLSKCNEHCLELQSRTDITKVEYLLVQQTAALTEIAAGIKQLLEKP